MEKEYDIKLSNGSKITIDTDDRDKAYSEFIDVFFKPYYLKTNDINRTINKSIKEIERVSSIFRLSRKNLIEEFLAKIEERLPGDIAELTGCDKIEILFENIDDYVNQIQNEVKSDDTREVIRLKISSLLENLNLFELAELVIHFAKRIQ